MFLWQNSGRRTDNPPGRRASGRKAFSLVELLIVLALIITLTTLMWSHSSGNYQRTQKELCQDNLQKCYMALQIFANDHDGRLPAATDAQNAETPLSQLVPRYSADTTIFICPGSKDAPLPSGVGFEQRKISYAYYMGRQLTGAAAALMSDRQVDTSAKAAGQPLFSATGKPPGDNHSKFGGNVLFTDGHAEFSPAAAAFALPLGDGVVLLNPRP
jgi:prepilin-type processing-associated H-X9-DG protein